MVIDESISSIQRTVAHLKSTDADYDTHEAILAAPAWFIEQVGKLFEDKKQTPEDVVDTIAECKLVPKDDIDEPFTIAHDGRLFPVLPAWALKRFLAELAAAPWGG